MKKIVTTIALTINDSFSARRFITISPLQLNSFYRSMQLKGVSIYIANAVFDDDTITAVFPFTKWNEEKQCHEFQRLEDSAGTVWWTQE